MRSTCTLNGTAHYWKILKNRRPNSGLGCYLEDTASHCSARLITELCFRTEMSCCTNPEMITKAPPPVRFITRFSTQQQELRSILGRHWYILLNDPFISKYIKSYPEMVFCRAPSIQDRLTSSHNIPNSDHSCASRGIVECGRWDMCPWIHQGTEFVLPNGRSIHPPFLRRLRHTRYCLFDDQCVELSMWERPLDLSKK